MPKLGLTMQSGTVVKWRKNAGERVLKGEILFEVMTDKVNLEVEANHNGYLRKILAEEGMEVPVGEVIAYVSETMEDAVPASQDRKKSVQEEVEQKNHIIEESNVRISPLARKLVAELGVKSLKGIIGSGPDGRIQKDDVVAYVQNRQGAADKRVGIADIDKPYSGGMKVKCSKTLSDVKKLIAERMIRSQNTIPHIVLNSVVDATNLVHMKEDVQDKLIKSHGIKITLTDFFLKSYALSLRENIELNSSLQGEKCVIYEDINIGFAVSTDAGLLVPIIHSCDTLGVRDIAFKRNDLVKKAYENSLVLDEVQKGTATLSNLGMYGVRSFSALINPPQATILAVGELYKAPSCAHDTIQIGFFVELSLSCDHRIVDGAQGAKLLKTVKALIEHPDRMPI